MTRSSDTATIYESLEELLDAMDGFRKGCIELYLQAALTDDYLEAGDVEYLFHRSYDALSYADELVGAGLFVRISDDDGRLRGYRRVEP